MINNEGMSLEEAFNIFGIPFPSCSEEYEEILETWDEVSLRRRYHELIFKNHPDRTHNATGAIQLGVARTVVKKFFASPIPTNILLNKRKFWKPDRAYSFEDVQNLIDFIHLHLPFVVASTGGRTTIPTLVGGQVEKNTWEYKTPAYFYGKKQLVFKDIHEAHKKLDPIFQTILPNSIITLKIPPEGKWNDRNRVWVLWCEDDLFYSLDIRPYRENLKRLTK